VSTEFNILLVHKLQHDDRSGTIGAPVHRIGACFAAAPFYLAQMGQVMQPSVGSRASNLRDWFLLVGILLGVSLVAGIIFIAYYSRSRRRHRHSHHHSHQSDTDLSEPRQKRRKHRHRRSSSSHERYPANPTLAETGGLPPPRPDDQPPKF
jgi:hypothetical protein